MTKQEVSKILNNKNSSKDEIVRAMSTYWKEKGQVYQAALDDFFSDGEPVKIAT